jgi:hypothetical protein
MAGTSAEIWNFYRQNIFLSRYIYTIPLDE